MCVIDGCERPLLARGWCRAHYLKWQKWGDPLAIKRIGLAKGHKFREVVTYNGAHQRVVSARGPAKEHICRCGQRAKDWAYDHRDASELTGDNGHGRAVPYSLDVDRYEPLCRPCHSKQDAEPRRLALSTREEE